ncbi:hypothetical protein [Streptomyces halobius]|uniref:hypothetical protein n=1 Tax=Streptomyces halobius TaxID=2879846 RepID=UPI0038738E3C
MVHSALCGVDATLHRLAEVGLRPEVADRTVIPLGPVLRCRQAWLRRQGLLSDSEEGLVIIRAEHF